MSTLWRKVLVDFWTNKIRTFLMVLTITLGVFSVGLVGNMWAMVSYDMNADFDSANAAHGRVVATRFDEEWVRALRKVPGVKDTEGRTRVMAKLIKTNGEKIAITFEAPKSFDAIHLNLLKPVNPLENMPIPDWQEVVFDNSAADLGYKPGDIVDVELANGTKRKLKFKGYVHNVTTMTPYKITNIVDALVTSNTILWLGGPEDYNLLLYSVSENGTDTVHVTDVAHAITDRFEKDDNVGDTQIIVFNPGQHFGLQTMQGIVAILSLLGWITVFVSIFLIINTITALMSQHVRQIGIMKAIGGSYRQIFSMYLTLILLFGVPALVISIPIANLAAYQISLLMAGFLNYESNPIKYDLGIVITQIALAFLVPVVAGFFPLLNGLRIPVREALNNYGIGNESPSKNQPMIRVDFFPRPVVLSLRNAVRKKTRLSLTLMALMLGGVIFIAVLNLRASFGQTIQDMNGYFLSDIIVTFTRLHSVNDIEPIVMKTSGVVSIESWLSASALLMSDNGKTSNEISFTAPPANSTMIKPIIIGGRWLTPLDKNAIVISDALLQLHPGLKVGDWITIKLNHQKTKWQIVGVYLILGNIPIPWVYTNYEYLAQLIHQTNKVYSLHLITSEHDIETQKRISNQLEDAFKSKKIDIASIEQSEVWVGQQKASTDVLVYVMLVMAFLIAFVGGLGLMGTMSINVMERTREIGVMRAIGATDRDIQMIVLTEGLAVGLVSWGMSVLFAVPITYLLDYGVGTAVLHAPLPVIFSWSGSFIWLIGILLVAMLSSVIPAWRASRLTVRDTLVYE